MGFTVHSGTLPAAHDRPGCARAVAAVDKDTALVAWGASVYRVHVRYVCMLCVCAFVSVSPLSSAHFHAHARLTGPHRRSQTVSEYSTELGTAFANPFESLATEELTSHTPHRSHYTPPPWSIHARISPHSVHVTTPPLTAARA